MTVAPLPPCPTWPTRRIVFCDDAILVVDKPAGLSVRASTSLRESDLVTRMLAWSRAQGIQDPYLGVHQHLDRDVSGLVVLARSRAANASLAQQAEAGKLVPRFRAVLRPVPALETWNLAPKTLSLPGKKARPCSLRVNTVQRYPPLCLAEITLQSGAPGALRDRLQLAQCTILGDTPRDPTARHRVYLHASELHVEHPTRHEPMVFRAPEPAYFHPRDVHGEQRQDVLLLEALEARAALAPFPDHNVALRLVNGAGDGLAPWTLDWYAGWALVQLYETLPEAELEALYDRIMAHTGALGLYVKHRPRQASTLRDEDREALCPPMPVRGVPHPEDFTMTEHGLHYGVTLGQGLSTGIFLDQRDNRARLMKEARDLRVLNLFSYTGAFSVAAAAGGAAQTVSVDLSKQMAERCTDNFRRNGLSHTGHVAVAAEVFGWLEGAAARGDRFDWVVVDPPGFSSAKNGQRFSAATDYHALIERICAVLAPEGRVLACTNHRGITNNKLERLVREGFDRGAHTVATLEHAELPADFPAEPGQEGHLKSLWIRTNATHTPRS